MEKNRYVKEQRQKHVGAMITDAEWKDFTLICIALGTKKSLIIRQAVKDYLAANKGRIKLDL